MQRAGRLSCKVLYSSPRSQLPTDDAYEISKQQALIQGLVFGTEGRSRDYLYRLVSFWLYGEQQLSDIHDSPFNSILRTSIVELAQGDAVHANIAL
jgi:hypothetical protein